MSNLCEIGNDVVETRKEQLSPNAKNNGNEELWQYSGGIKFARHPRHPRDSRFEMSWRPESRDEHEEIT